ncbi:MAG: glycosyltransferase, partial [Dehalococcoidia bacterium]|nr:glycosyltransferase [Dehalococcoidia bacterium]
MPVPDLSIVIPAYNEATRLGPTLTRLLADLAARPFTSEIIVVDDGSRDGTADLARSFAAPNLRVIAYHPNHGKGRAVRTGILAAQGRVVGFMDADLSTDLEALDRALAAIASGYDLVVGSRGLASSQTLVAQPLYRRVGARIFNVIQHALSGV